MTRESSPVLRGFDVDLDHFTDCPIDDKNGNDDCSCRQRLYEEAVLLTRENERLRKALGAVTTLNMNSSGGAVMLARQEALDALGASEPDERGTP